MWFGNKESPHIVLWKVKRLMMRFIIGVSKEDLSKQCNKITTIAPETPQGNYPGREQLVSPRMRSYWSCESKKKNWLHARYESNKEKKKKKKERNA